ncbi:DUF1102 domain-containing protein [Natrinema halophilum]|uniref:DUF1102 domain-containing protein n=1 Tax=Natrinema halophilum TaxID=1699371 RepID=A0A7D5GME8_9EURY|nr:DUF1102 domain-containing protein [Natrinema halophilum]QLG50072.1 DUF1102 domain-containing protein [Natrinema halophilum]
MYVPRGKLLALVAFILAASMVTATGAFTSVKADRTAEVKVTGDEDAFLGLEANEEKGYAKNEGGTLGLYLSENADIKGSGQGVNPEAVTTIDNVFTITNQGAQEVSVRLDYQSAGDTVTFYDSDSGKPINGNSISPGEEINVGIEVDTTGYEYSGNGAESLIKGNDGGEVTVIAESDEKAAGGPDSGSSGNGGSSSGE